MAKVVEKGDVRNTVLRQIKSLKDSIQQLQSAKGVKSTEIREVEEPRKKKTLKNQINIIDKGISLLKHTIDVLNKYKKHTTSKKASLSSYIRSIASTLEEDNLLPLFREYLNNTADDWNYITPEEFEKIRNGQAKDWFILDIRRPEDFKSGHIPGATNIFWLDLLKPENLEKLPRDKKILVYCYVGHTSSQIMTLLKLLGYDVVSLKFGMGISPVEGIPVAGWTDFGYEVVQ